MEWMLVLILESGQPYLLGRLWPSYESCAKTAAFMRTEPLNTLKKNKKRRIDRPDGKYIPIENLESQIKADHELFDNLRCLPYNEH